MEVGRLLDISAGTKRMGQNQAEVNAHPSQIAFGAPMLHLEIFVCRC
jgi:hypothetical protein